MAVEQKILTIVLWKNLCSSTQVITAAISGSA
jgi:hypothetical protein